MFFIRVFVYLSVHLSHLTHTQIGALKCAKLAPSLLPKVRYVVHYHNLQLYVKLGICVSRCHCDVSFEQRAWMRSCIEKNTELRRMATTVFYKDFFKLMNNSVFGKTMENIRNHSCMKLFEPRWKRLSSFERSQDYLPAQHSL